MVNIFDDDTNRSGPRLASTHSVDLRNIDKYTLLPLKKVVNDYPGNFPDIAKDKLNKWDVSDTFCMSVTQFTSKKVFYFS